MQKELQKVKKELSRHGLLLLSDPTLPSLVATIAGEPVSGTWWSHPQGNLMFNISNELADDHEILAVKFINKKITYLDSRHWDAFFAIAMSQAEWQLKRLPPDSKRLYDKILENKELRADDTSFKKSPAEIGKIASKLEERLLLFSDNVHTESGKYVRIFKSWQQFAKDRKMKVKKMKYEEALTHFEKLGFLLLDEYEAPIKWPWK